MDRKGRLPVGSAFPKSSVQRHLPQNCPEESSRKNEKLVIMALYRSPLTVTLWPSSFLKKYEPMIPPPIKRTKQSVFLDVTVFRHTLVD
ncbi:hypothetical protein TNCV_4397161 [Trichonephila clavipes]|nr:hypothetical protein TNCV_4397161 [Trichonephila clavipes]